MDDPTHHNPNGPVIAPAAMPVLTAEPMSDESRVIVDKLLDGSTDSVRLEAIKQIGSLAEPERERVGSFLAKFLLDPERNRLKRSWCVSGLAATNVPHAAGIIAGRLDPAVEKSEAVRYWAAVELVGLKPPQWKETLEAALPGNTPRVQAGIMRLLIDNGFEEYIDKLLNLAADTDWRSSVEGCRALRLWRGRKPFRESIEVQILHLLTPLVQDESVTGDVRYQAICALGGLQHRWLEVIRVLRRLLEEQNLPDWLRRACVEALAQISKPETRDTLLLVLCDPDAGVRMRAAEVLRQCLGATNAIHFVVDHLLQQEQPPSIYLDALRQIEQKTAANVLSDNLLHPDPKIADRAARALTLLGGEEAVRSLQAQRTKAVEKYTEMLGKADEQIMQQFNSLINQAQTGFRLSMWMHGIIFGLGVIVLAASLYVALSGRFDEFERYVGLSTAAGSLGTLLFLFYKDPLQNIRHSVTNLVKVNVVFLGYMRQINQIDATFKQMFLSSADFGTTQMRETVEQIQVAVKQTMDEVKTHLTLG